MGPVDIMDVNALRGAQAHAGAPRRFRPRALPTIAAFAALLACLAAARWQHDRMTAKELLRAEYDAASQRAAVDLAHLPIPSDPAPLRYVPVTVDGAYDASRQFLVDNRVRAGRAGYEVVTPLTMADGRIVLVDRGWIAQGASRAELPQAAPPSGIVTVRGRLAVPSQHYLELRQDAAPGPLRQNLDLRRFEAASNVPVLPVVVEATAAPVPDDGLVRERPLPDFGIDTHRIYMVQWYAFAALVVALWVWFHRPGKRAARP